MKLRTALQLCSKFGTFREGYDETSLVSHDLWVDDYHYVHFASMYGIDGPIQEITVHNNLPNIRCKCQAFSSLSQAIAVASTKSHLFECASRKIIVDEVCTAVSSMSIKRKLVVTVDGVEAKSDSKEFEWIVEGAIKYKSAAALLDWIEEFIVLHGES